MSEKILPAEAAPSGPKLSQSPSKESEDTAVASAANTAEPVNILEKTPDDVQPIEGQPDASDEYLEGKKLAIAFVSMLLAVFLIALDQVCSSCHFG